MAKDDTIMLQYVGSSQAPFFEFMTREHQFSGPTQQQRMGCTSRKDTL